VRILVATDSFPPACGGSGWSTWELARALRARGHAITVVQPRPGQAAHGTREYDGFVVDEFAWSASAIPFVRNYVKNERLWTALSAHLRQVIVRDGIDVVHAQHVLTAPAATDAARATTRPVVVTVRDYWPVCYWGTMLVDPTGDDLCPACSTSGMVACLRGRTGLLWPAALGAIPYMRANLGRKQAALADADAVIAVSGRIGQDLVARSAGLDPARVHVVPNPFDLAAIRDAAVSRPAPLSGPYAVYAGKLEPNKGADLLPRVAADAGLQMPLVVLGDGRLQEPLARDAAARGIDLRVHGWQPREEVLGWIAGAALLVFPSRGPESLSRVLVEASALGVAIAAMDTGGTRDVVEPDVTGLLSADAAGLAHDVARLAGDESLRRRLGAAARARADARFASAAVVSRVETIYALVCEGHGHA
jgi:glycosyltransferase involved in cell wall biosynthesis